MGDLETIFVFMAYTWAIVRLNDMLNDIVRKFQR